jgi:hypothetical protein
MAGLNEMAQAQQIPGLNPLDFIQGATGFAQVVGMNPAGITAGLFANTTMVAEVDDAAGFVKRYGDAIGGLNNTETQGLSITTSFAASPEQVAGVPAHRWSMRLQPDANDPAAQQMQFVMPMLFGPGGGPGGYIAAADNDSVVMTYSSSQQNLTTAVKAVQNGGALAADQLFAAQAGRLHSDAFAVGYVDIGSIMRQVLPFAAMMGAPIQFEVPEQVAPIAMSAASDAGGVSFRTVVPAEVLKLFGEIGAAANGGGGGFEGGDEEDPQF